MTIKAQKIYRWISTLTLVVPMLGIFIWFIITGNDGVEILMESPDVYFGQAIEDYDFITDPSDYVVINTINSTITFQDDVFQYDESIVTGTITVSNEGIFRINGDWYEVNPDNPFNLRKFDYITAIKDTIFEYSLSIGINIMLLGIAISFVTLTITKKMKIGLMHRRLTVLIYLAFGTIMFLALSLITEKIYMTFLVATLAWGSYYIEWIIMRKKSGLPLTDQLVVVARQAKDGE